MRTLILMAFFAALLAIASCSDHSEMTVGFLGPLEGKYSDLGVQGRNGVQLALEEANAQDIIPGVHLRLAAADDRNTEAGTELAMNELAAAKAVAVIGPMISGVAEAALAKADRLGIPLISPTVSAPALTGKRDLFFRVLGENLQWARSLARHGRERQGLSTAAFITDMDNESYAAPFRDSFKTEFLRLGGKVLKEWDVHSSSMDSWNAIADQIEQLQPDVVVISLSARDAVSLGKTFMARGQKVRVYSAMWAATRELATEGGAACAGWTFGMGYSEDNPSLTLKAFRDRFAKRFGFAPNFAAVLSYEATQAMLQGLVAARNDPRKLAETLAKLPELPGVLGPFRMDEYGDVQRASYIVTFNGTEFHTDATIQ